jgi:hypothetical protein
MDDIALTHASNVAIGFLIWLLPVIMIIKSNRTTRNEKIAWVLAVILVSWFAWLFYLLLAPLKRG